MTANPDAVERLAAVHGFVREFVDLVFDALRVHRGEVATAEAANLSCVKPSRRLRVEDVVADGGYTQTATASQLVS